MITFPNLEGATREIVLYRVQHAIKVLTEVEESLCISEEEEKEMANQVSTKE
jgi:hypothetical protein